MKEWEGVFPLWKVAGMTSHDCVSKARRLFGMKRIGHTGTLDPEVSGVLPLCLGRATRIVEYMQELPKTYEAEMTIGYATDTEDATGTIVERSDQVLLTEEQIHSVIATFHGVIEQTPPMYSAVKVEGKRLYELAREGKVVERKSRKVTIHHIDVTAVDVTVPYPVVRMSVRCSKGTYIRTLCTDIGRALGYPAVMSALVRTGSGAITKGQCVTFEEAERLKASGELEQAVMPTELAISHLPRGIVSDAAVLPALQGRKLFRKAVRLEDSDPAHENEQDNDVLYRFFGRDPSVHEESDQRFLGLYRFDPTGDTYIPVKLFT